MISFRLKVDRSTLGFTTQRILNAEAFSLKTTRENISFRLGERITSVFVTADQGNFETADKGVFLTAD